jgi:anaerobic selenocysteine-containing dehydrogenase
MQITWIDAETIRKVARFYAANKPACILGGNAYEQNMNSYQTHRAISILKSIAGNLGIPGGELQRSPLPPLDVLFSRDFILYDEVPKDVRELGLNQVHGLLPNVVDVPPHLVVKAILEEDPYPIRAAYVQGANPLISWCDSQATYKAIQKLDFLAVIDLFMTPTAALADIVLPVTTYMESDAIHTHVRYAAAQVQQKILSVDECWSDLKVINELAKKMGLEKYFWDSDQHCLDSILKSSGLTFKQFQEKGGLGTVNLYRDYYEAEGFKTPSHKVELYSNELKKWNFDPLPVYREPPETAYSSSELAEEYPLILTSRKFQCYRHTEGRQIASLRDSHPDPIIEIHPIAAKNLKIEDGDWVYIETKRGRIKQKAKLTECIDPRVVFAEYDWWFPEKDASELFGWAESNFNMLTSNALLYNREVGSVNLRGMLCKVYPIRPIVVLDQLFRSS